MLVFHSGKLKSFLMAQSAPAFYPDFVSLPFSPLCTMLRTFSPKASSPGKKKSFLSCIQQREREHCAKPQLCSRVTAADIFISQAQLPLAVHSWGKNPATPTLPKKPKRKARLRP